MQSNLGEGGRECAPLKSGHAESEKEMQIRSKTCAFHACINIYIICKKSYNMRWFQNPDNLAGLFVIGMRRE